MSSTEIRVSLCVLLKLVNINYSQLIFDETDQFSSFITRRV